MKTFCKFTIAFLFTVVLSWAAIVQAAEPGALKTGQKVQVEYYPDSKRWIPATIIEVVNDGYSYKVKVAPYGDGK